MSYKLINISSSVTIDSISTLTSSKGSFSIPTEGQFPLGPGQELSGLTTSLSDGQGSPYVTVLMYAPENDVEIVVSIDGNFYSQTNNSSGLISFLIPEQLDPNSYIEIGINNIL